MKDLLGSEAEAFFASYETPAHRGLFLNPLAGSLESLCSMLEGCDLPLLSPVPWESRGRYFEDCVPFGKHVFHEGGFYYIQEPSAMAPVSFLDPQPGEYVLDLCAAPGGKSTQIGAKMKGSGLLVSNEIHPDRARILSENVERMGLSNTVVTSAAPDVLSAHFPLFFDKILVDAPCSGEGMFGKNEEAALQWSEDAVALCAERQFDILTHADLMLRPGGCIVYSTCTFSKEENEDLILRFLESHLMYELCDMPLCGGMVHGFCEDSPDKMVRLLPHKLEGEGHFAALLRKKGPTEKVPSRSFMPEKQKKKKTPSSSVSLSPLFDFLEAFLSDKPKSAAAERLKALTPSDGPDQLFLMGSQVYLLPDPMIRSHLQQLKLLRPGLHLGSLEKGRFEPSMALARALLVDDIIYYVNLSASSDTDRALLASYFAGNTFPLEGEKGWYLIAMAGRGMGWGKLAGGIMKNHYPKGLRKQLLSSDSSSSVSSL